MAKHAAPEPVPVGTVYTAGEPTPPVTTDKTTAAVAWGLPPAIVAAILVGLQQFGTIFPDSPPVVLQIITLILVIATPITAAYGAYSTPNRLKQDIRVIGTDPEVAPDAV